MAYMKDKSGKRLDSFTSRPGTRRNRVVLLGDSYWEYNGGPRKNAGLVTWDSKGCFVWANFFLGQALRVVKNVGVGGQQMSAFLARVPADVDAYDPDWVIGTGGINDVNNGRTDTQIIADFTALFTYLIDAQGYRVTWNTINSISGWSNAQLLTQATVNQWLRTEAPTLWPGLIVVDAFNAVFQVSSGTIPATYRIDTTHLGPAGAIRVGKAMADAMRPHVPNGFTICQPYNGSNSLNLLTNGRFNNPSSGVAAGWTGSGTNVVHSQVVRTDEPEGFWQRMEVTSNGSGSLQVGNIALDPTKITPGTDRIRFAVEVQVSGLDLVTPTAKTQRFNARLQLFDVSSTLLADYSGSYADGNYDNLLLQPGRGVLATPEVLVPSNATKATVTLSATGTGRFEWDKATLTRVLSPAY